MGWLDREEDQIELLNDILGVLKENLQTSKELESALAGKPKPAAPAAPPPPPPPPSGRARPGKIERRLANRALFGRRGIEGSLLALKHMIPTAGGVGGILGFIAWAIGNEAEYNAKTQAIINRMKSVGDVNASMFDKMKERYKQLQVFGAEGDLGALATSMANRGVGEEAFLRRTGISIRGGDKTGQYGGPRDDVATVTQALDYDTGQAVGTSFEAVGQAVATTGESLESATQAMVDLRTATKGTGISFQSLLQTMTQASSALRLQTGDTKSLAAGYMFARKAMARFFGGETAENKYQVSSFAQQGFDDIIKAVAGMDDTARALAAQGMVERDLRKKNPGASDDQIQQLVQEEIQKYGGMAGFISFAEMNKLGGLNEKQTSLAWIAEYMTSYLRLIGMTPDKMRAGIKDGPDGRPIDPRAAEAYGIMQRVLGLSSPGMMAGLEIASEFEKSGDYSKALQSDGASKALEELTTAEERRAQEESAFKNAQRAFMQAMIKIGLGSASILRSIAASLVTGFYMLANPLTYDAKAALEAGDQANNDLSIGLNMIGSGVSGAIDALGLGLDAASQTTGGEIKAFRLFRDHYDKGLDNKSPTGPRIMEPAGAQGAKDIIRWMKQTGRLGAQTLPTENGEIRIYAEWVGGGAVPGSGWE